jgi:hypothetical protein
MNGVAKVTVSFLVLLALYFCGIAWAEVTHSRLITDARPTILILAIGSAGVVACVVWSWLATTRRSFYCSFTTSMVLLLFSVACLCT